MNKTKLIIIILMLSLIGLLVILLVSNKKPSPSSTAPIPVFSPSPNPYVKPVTTLEEELQAEQNYAMERKKILTEKPWLLKMPIRNEDYWLSYDTELEVFDALIYYSKRFPKDDQITQIKQRIVTDLAKIGVDATKVKINYTEKEI